MVIKYKLMFTYIYMSVDGYIPRYINRSQCMNR